MNIAFFSFFELSFINLKPLSIQRKIIITSLFRKLAKVSRNDFKIGISGIPDPLEMCKNIKYLFNDQLEILSHVVEKQEVEALHNSYLNALL